MLTDRPNREQRFHFYHILLLAVLIFSCQGKHNRPGPSGYVDDTFAEELGSMLGPADTTPTRKLRPISNYVRLVYQMDDHQPMWVKEHYRPTDAAARLIAELEDTHWDGADTSQYRLADIATLKAKLESTKHNAVADAIRFDTLLTHAYLSAARFLLLGQVSPRKADSLWFHQNDSVWKAPEWLTSSNGSYPSLESYRSQWPTYGLLREELKLYNTLAQDSSYVNAVFNMQQYGQDDTVLRMSADYIILSEFPWLEIVHNDTITDHKQLLLAYQRYKSLRQTGKLDSVTVATLATGPENYTKQLRANMERLRWMTQSPGGLYIVVNVPLMELRFRRDSMDLMRKRVVVGRTARQTPSLGADMANIVINPQWAVPPTILKKDVMPGIAKSGKQYLDKKGLRIYDKEGKRVAVSNVDWDNYRKYTYRQAPGDDNSLGYVKFNMPNKWDIYLHDTPHREDFGKRDRALSSGCVRVHDPKELALFILSDLENKKQYTAGRLDTLIAGHKTKWENLKTKIPVFITYLTAFEDSTGHHLIYTRDIYQRDAKLMAMMK